MKLDIQKGGQHGFPGGVNLDNQGGEVRYPGGEFEQLEG